MVLVDTSVWVEHLRRGIVALAGELEAGQARRGIGFVDSSTRVGHARSPARLWTSDRRLAAIAGELNVAYESARR